MLKNRMADFEDIEKDDLEELTDEKVEKLQITWDIVRCKICGKKISMLTEKIVTSKEGNEYFVCKEH